AVEIDRVAMVDDRHPVDPGPEPVADALHLHRIPLVLLERAPRVGPQRDVLQQLAPRLVVEAAGRGPRAVQVELVAGHQVLGVDLAAHLHAGIAGTLDLRLELEDEIAVAPLRAEPAVGAAAGETEDRSVIDAVDAAAARDPAVQGLPVEERGPLP